MRRLIDLGLTKAEKLVRRRRSGPPSPFFDCFQDALDDCGGNGYLNSEIAEVVIKKNELFREQLRLNLNIPLDAARTLVGLLDIGSRSKIRVLDFGGGGGYHFHIARNVLPTNIEVRWNVVETEHMAALANQRLRTEEVGFFHSIEDAASDLGEIDLVLASGSLQYTESPRLTLTKLVDLRAENFFVTRTPLAEDGRTYYGKQKSWLRDNGPGPLPSGFQDGSIEYPFTVIDYSETLAIIETNYDIRFILREDRAAYKIRDCVFDMYGFYGSLRPKENDRQ